MSTQLPETPGDRPNASPRIALVGPRRIRQGLGPYFARSVTRHDARLAAFACSRESSLAVATEELRAIVGHEVPGYIGVDAMLDADREIDAVIIASPVPAHARALESALAHGVPVLCEKPFLAPGSEAVDRAMQLCAAFCERGLPLMVHAQWPETLPAYRALFPDLFVEPPTSFRMELAPGSIGIDALVDSIPHPLSLLQAVSGEESAEHADVENIVIHAAGPEPGESGRVHIVRFDWTCPGQPRIECRVDLAHRATQPRPAGYGFDGCFAAREIEQPDYRMFFRDCEPALGPAFGARPEDDPDRGRRVPVPDPLDRRVGRFLAALEKPVDRAAAFLPAHRMRMLTRILDAYPSSHTD